MYKLVRFEFPKYWEEIAENVDSADQVLARINELFAAHRSSEGEGVLFSVHNEQGSVLRIGCSDDGWVVMCDPVDEASRIAVGNDCEQGYKAFLIPEWTDIGRKYLIAPQVAETVARLWLETKQLSKLVSWVR